MSQHEDYETIDQYKQDEMRADAHQYHRDVMWEEFKMSSTDQDVLAEYNSEHKTDKKEDFIDSDDFREFEEVMFYEYMEHRN